MNIFKRLLEKRPFDSLFCWAIDKAEEEKHSKNLLINYLLFVVLMVSFFFKLVEDPLYNFFIDKDDHN